MAELNQELFPRRRLILSGIAAGGITLLTAPVMAAGKEMKKRRIVCIGGALTEIVYALGANNDLVGVDTTSLFPEDATKLPSVGYARSLSSEGILALSPSHVFATEDAGPASVLRQIEKAGIPVSVLAANHKFEGVLERINQIGLILERQNQAETLIQSLKLEWQKNRTAILEQKQKPASVMFILSHSPNQIMVGGKGCSAQAMLEYAAASNAVQGFSGFKPISPEAIIAAQPDMFLFTTQGLDAIGGIDGALRLPGISQTPAGKARKIIALEAMFMLGFGPRLPAAVTALNNLIRKAHYG